jgi:hypothetical protein
MPHAATRIQNAVNLAGNSEGLPGAAGTGAVSARCSSPRARIAAKRPRFRSFRARIALYTARTATSQRSAPLSGEVSVFTWQFVLDLRLGTVPHAAGCLRPLTKPPAPIVLRR